MPRVVVWLFFFFFSFLETVISRWRSCDEMKLKDSFIEFSRFGDLLLEIKRGSLKFPRTKTFVRVISHNIDEFFTVRTKDCRGRSSVSITLFTGRYDTMSDSRNSKEKLYSRDGSYYVIGQERWSYSKHFAVILRDTGEISAGEFRENRCTNKNVDFSARIDPIARCYRIKANVCRVRDTERRTSDGIYSFSGIIRLFRNKRRPICREFAGIRGRSGNCFFSRRTCWFPV